MSSVDQGAGSADESISRRRFLSGATTAGAVALSGLALSESTNTQAAPAHAGGETSPPDWFEGPDPSIPKVGLHWAFSATVFFR